MFAARKWEARLTSTVSRYHFWTLPLGVWSGTASKRVEPRHGMHADASCSAKTACCAGYDLEAATSDAAKTWTPPKKSLHELRGWSSHHFLFRFLLHKKKVGNFCEKPFVWEFLLGGDTSKKRIKKFTRKNHHGGSPAPPRGRGYSRRSNRTEPGAPNQSVK